MSGLGEAIDKAPEMMERKKKYNKKKNHKNRIDLHTNLAAHLTMEL